MADEWIPQLKCAGCGQWLDKKVNVLKNVNNNQNNKVK